MERVTLWSCHGDFDIFSTCLESFDTFSTHLEICFQNALKFSKLFSTCIEIFHTGFTTIYNMVHTKKNFKTVLFIFFICLMQGVI